nr:MAG TPA: hypothetical protein [Caudoviricetes sp.]
MRHLICLVIYQILYPLTNLRPLGRTTLQSLIRIEHFS